MTKGLSLSREFIAEALRRSDVGLETPPEMKLLEALNSLAAGYGAGTLGVNAAQALSRNVVPRLQNLGEAGAIFPEGMSLPAGKEAGREFMSVLPDAQQAYRRNEALANWHAQNYDFPAVLKDKWALLRHAGGN